MTAKTPNLEDQIHNLLPAERARLALALIESLDPGQDEDADELWLDEAERRLSDYDAGRVIAQPAGGVISEIKRRLK